MRILILSNSDSGLYQFRKELIRDLSASHTVICSVPNADGFLGKLEELGCTCVETDFNRRGTNPVSELKLFALYKKLIHKHKPDIVFTYTIKPNVYGGMACASLGVPYVANITGLGTAVENGGMMQIITLALYRLGLRKAQKVFFQNTSNRDFMLRHHVIRGQYDLLPGSGVKLDVFPVLPFPAGETVGFVFIARIRKEKGIDQYLEAAEAIRARYPQTRFHICGGCEEDYRNRLEDLQEKGVICYHGEVDNIRQIHAISQCTVHPTYYPEGMSNVLLESCACGRPIITTDRPGCREIVEDGINGFVVRQKDSADLIAKIERFLALEPERRRQMGLAGRAKVEREFDRKIVIEKYMGELPHGL